jgi:hypothetical protein
MANRRTYKAKMRALLSADERRVFARLTSPQKIQSFLDALPVNFELIAETAMSPRRVLQERVAHCAEGAIFAAAALAYHGRPPLLMDFQALPSDEDHVIAVFQERGLWGAISKTNHAVLRWRDPIYRSPRELAMSYAHEYFLWGGKKSLLAYSRPYSIARFSPKRWLTSGDDLYWLLLALDESPHEPLAPRAALRRRRRTSEIERRALAIVEWPDPRTRKRGS